MKKKCGFAVFLIAVGFALLTFALTMLVTMTAYAARNGGVGFWTVAAASAVAVFALLYGGFLIILGIVGIDDTLFKGETEYFPRA